MKRMLTIFSCILICATITFAQLPGWSEEFEIRTEPPGGEIRIFSDAGVTDNNLVDTQAGLKKIRCFALTFGHHWSGTRSSKLICTELSNCFLPERTFSLYRT